MKCWEILTVNEKMMVGEYAAAINKAKGDRDKQGRLKNRYRRYCVYLGEAHSRDGRWIEELYDYGTKERTLRVFPPSPEKSVQLSLFGDDGA